MISRVSRWMRAVTAVLVLSYASAICHAQFSANVSGTVTDPKGSVVPAASVTLHNVDTGVDVSGTTNSYGAYRFNAVAPGSYIVIVIAPGFAKTAVSAQLSTDETRGVDVALPVAGVNAAVIVTTLAPLLNPEEARLQNTITSNEISQLPLPNRDVQLLIALTPGVTGYQNENPSSGYGNSIIAGNFQPPYSANGLTTNSNLFLIDDLPVSDAQNQGAALILPNADMIAEVALQTQTYSVENGTAASLQTAFTTKTGTNGFHGDLDYSYDGKNIAAAHQPNLSGTAPTTENPDPEPIPDFHQNIILGSLGGPIIKDKTFFFGSVQRQNAGIGAVGSTTAHFTPEFLQWAQSAFPNSPTVRGLLFAPPTRDVGGTTQTAGASGHFNAGSKFPCDQVNTLTDGSATFNLPCGISVYNENSIFDQAQPFNGTQWNVRLDQNFRAGKDRVYGMYERIDQKLSILSERPALDAVTPSQNKYFSVNYTHIFTPALLNEAHFGNLRVINGSTLGDPRAASIPYLPIMLDTAYGFQFAFPFGTTPFGAQTDKQHTYAFRDNVSYTAGRHSLRGGYQFYRGDVFQDSSQIYSRPFVPFYFTDTFSFISNTAAAGYNLYTIGAGGTYTPQYYGATSLYNGAFVDDTWKIKANLTLTLGLRYDSFGNPSKYGSTAQPFAPLYPGAGGNFQQKSWNTTTRIASNAFTEGQNLNILPRVGFAYTPPERKDMLIRGGVGLYENVLTPFQIAGNLPTQPPNRISLFTNGVVPYGDFTSRSAPFGYDYSFPTYGTDPSGNIYSNPEKTQVFSADLNGFSPTIKPEKIVNYSLGLEQQFPWNVVLSLNYAGSHAYDLVYGSASANSGSNADYNLQPGSPKARPSAEWGRLNYGRNGLESNYNALIVVVKQNYKGFSYQANYNWSRVLQDAPTQYDATQNTTYQMWKGSYDPKTYYAPATFNVPNSFSFAGGYEVPKLFSGKLANEFAAGWRVSTLMVAQSGTPFSVLHAGVDYANDGSTNFDGTGKSVGLPNYSGTQRGGFSRTQLVKGAFTTAQFTDPAGVGTMSVMGNQSPSTFRNPGYFNIDTGIAKAFTVPLPHSEESGKLILRGEFVNLLNRTNYQGIVADTADSHFGLVTAANQKRYLQIGGRFEF